MNETVEKILVGAYLFLLTALCLVALIYLAIVPTGPDIQSMSTTLKCAATGGLGGCLYCLRGMYLNISVKNQWARQWLTWYVIRPFASAGCGAVSFLFLKAGLLVLEAGEKPSATEIGYFALAFIAGFNVDKFLGKLEDVAQAVWGIEKSRAGSSNIRDER